MNEVFECPKCHAKIAEDELHSCTGASYFAPGLMKLLRQLNKAMGGEIQPVPAPAAPENAFDKKARGREKRG